jgi:hypothetical protein
MTYYNKDPSEVPSVWISGEEISGKFESLDSLIEALTRRLEDIEDRINKIEEVFKIFKPSRLSTKEDIKMITKEELEAIRNIAYQSQNGDDD